MITKFRRGKKYWIKSLQQYGTLVSAIKDSAVLELEDGDAVEVNPSELSKSP